jgi:hypothetical protein
VLAQRQIDHRGHGKPAFRRQSHGLVPGRWGRKYLNIFIDYTIT